MRLTMVVVVLVLAGVLGLLVVFHLAQLWHVYLLASLLGVVAAVDSPARQAFVSELVPVEDLPNAVGLNSASFHAGRLIGPGVLDPSLDRRSPPDRFRVEPPVPATVEMVPARSTLRMR